MHKDNKFMLAPLSVKISVLFPALNINIIQLLNKMSKSKVNFHDLYMKAFKRGIGMNLHEIENNMDYLFTIALKKCGSFEDAEDLAQDVILSALQYSAEVSNVKAWLSAVMNHKYYDMLRRKYRLPVISIDNLAEEPGYTDETEAEQSSDYSVLRREIAYLSQKYRDVIIRYYLNGEKIQSIADDLQLPKGTVLSRLSSGREQIQKGLSKMKSYDKQSYSPFRLEISLNGFPGLNDEPRSCISDDLMKQNILIAAYDKPLTCTEIARILGIPSAYIEKAVEDLVLNELMSRKGNKIYTDFLLTTPEQNLKALNSQIDFAKRYYKIIWNCIKEAVNMLRKLDWYQQLPSQQRGKCEYYYILHIFSKGIYNALRKIMHVDEQFPRRPNGGRWVALGYIYPENFNFDNYKLNQYSYGGERKAEYRNIFGSNSICLHIYDTQPDLNKYNNGPVEISDDELCMLLYLVYKKIPVDTVAFNPIYLKAIPHLTECGIFRDVNGKPQPDIPIIGKREYNEMDKLCTENMYKLAEILIEPLAAEMSKFKVPVPKHLEARIVEFRKYLCYSIPMAIIKEAIRQNDFIVNEDEAHPPMILVVD